MAAPPVRPQAAPASTSAAHSAVVVSSGEGSALRQVECGREALTGWAGFLEVERRVGRAVAAPGVRECGGSGASSSAATACRSRSQRCQYYCGGSAFDTGDCEQAAEMMRAPAVAEDGTGCAGASGRIGGQKLYGGCGWPPPLLLRLVRDQHVVPGLLLRVLSPPAPMRPQDSCARGFACASLRAVVEPEAPPVAVV